MRSTMDAACRALFSDGARRWRRPVAGPALAAAVLAGCANVPLSPGHSLSYGGDLSPHDGRLTKASLKVDGEAVLRARTVSIVPTAFSPEAAAKVEASQDRRIVANMIDRSLCIGLSDRFVVVAAEAPSDLRIHATVTNVLATNPTAAGISTAASLGSSAVLPVSVPRLPIGLGGLSVEAEALAPDGTPKAAMIWARGANVITEKARMSEVGDAYGLGAVFGGDFSRMLVTGRSPFGGLPALSSPQKMAANLGGRPRYAACEAFGRAPGIGGIVSGQLGLPPGWSDRGDTRPRRDGDRSTRP